MGYMLNLTSEQLGSLSAALALVVIDYPDLASDPELNKIVAKIERMKGRESGNSAN